MTDETQIGAPGSEALRRAIELHRAGRAPEALEIYREVLRGAPGDVNALYYGGLALLEAGRPGEAVDLLAKLTRLRADLAAGHYYHGLALSKAGDIEGAVAAYHRALEIDPEFVEALVDSGNAWSALGEIDRAIEAFGRAVGLRPDHAGAHLNLGIAYKRQRRINEAIAAYRRAIEIQPDFADAHYNLGVLYGDIRSRGQAADAYERALDQRPDFPRANANLGNTYRLMHRLDDAEAAYARALADRPEHLLSLTNFPYVLSELGRHDDAIATARRAAALDPSAALVHNSLGAAFAAAGDTTAAAGALRRALALKPGDSEPLSRLAGVLRGDGRLNEIIADCYDSLDALDEDQAAGRAALHAALAGFHLELGDPGAALSAAGFALAIIPGDALALSRKALALHGLGRDDAYRELVDCDRMIWRRRCDAPAGFGATADFNAALARHVIGHPSLVDERDGGAAQGGQRTGMLLVEPKGPIAALEGMICEAVEAYARDIAAPADHPVVAHAPGRWSLDVWAIVLRAQDHRMAHIQPAGWLSGVYYAGVAEPVSPSGDGHAGWISFADPPAIYAAGSTPEATLVGPEEGLMLLFPSYYFQRTAPFSGDGECISVVFDVIAHP